MPSSSEHEQHVSAYVHCPKCRKRLNLKNLKGHERKRCPSRTSAKVLAAQKKEAAAAAKAKRELELADLRQQEDARRQREQEAQRYRYR